MIDYKGIEEKWNKIWEENKIYEADVCDKKPLLVTAAWPYPNGPQHIGHLLTFGTADVYARYKRMQGYNVLFPMGIHKTGTPVLAIAKRILNKDPKIYEEYKNFFNIPETIIEKMTDPMFVADYFASNIFEGIKKAGLGIDWRRSFTSIDPQYSKMVEWQFQKLKEKGLLVQGRHAVGWCPNEGNPVGQHDTNHDVQPEIEEIIAIKFKDKNSDTYFPCGTYRPETIYGVTNLFINKKAKYVEVEIDGQKFYLAKTAAESLAYQLKLQIIKEIQADELVNKKAINPITGEELPILYGFFVNDDFGTGIVMSVPAHAPFDYVALKRLEKEGFAVPQEPYKRVLNINNDSNSMSMQQKYFSLGVDDIDNEEIERITAEIYKEEAHKGVMAIGEFAGMSEIDARKKIIEKLKVNNMAFSFFILANSPIFCRCGSKVVVKIVEDQWFINYGDSDWKAKVNEYFPSIFIYPEKMRKSYENTISWLDMRASERSQGLGTKFPFNPAHIIESLSDSTIYMAFYTFSNILKAGNVPPEKLKPEFFDYIFESKGSPDEIAASTGIDALLINKCKESFEYWYKFTSRHSASELIFSHLTMYIFNHVALFQKEFWPKQIVTNGMLLYEGSKMSKSIGNTVPVLDAIEKYNADPLRMAIIAQADLSNDSDFRVATIDSIKSKLEYLQEVILQLDNDEGKELNTIDFWLYSKLNKKIKLASAYMDKIQIKSAASEIFYNSINELKRYRERGGNNKLVLSEYISALVKMLSPIMPFISEEFWHELGNTTFISKENWPNVNESLINTSLEECENIVDSTIIDIDKVIELSSKIPANKGKKPVKANIIIASQWKIDLYNILAETKDIQKALEIVQDKEKANKYISKFKNLMELSQKININAEQLYSSFVDSIQYIRDKINMDVFIINEDLSNSVRAPQALPNRPAIEIEWK
ncbi:MAG: leucine--tRNA ligase [Candidatus Micrarchaeaceae archaeon]